MRIELGWLDRAQVSLLAGRARAGADEAHLRNTAVLKGQKQTLTDTQPKHASTRLGPLRAKNDCRVRARRHGSVVVLVAKVGDEVIAVVVAKRVF